MLFRNRNSCRTVTPRNPRVVRATNVFAEAGLMGQVQPVTRIHTFDTILTRAVYSLLELLSVLEHIVWTPQVIHCLRKITFSGSNLGAVQCKCSGKSIIATIALRQSRSHKLQDLPRKNFGRKMQDSNHYQRPCVSQTMLVSSRHSSMTSPVQSGKRLATKPKYNQLRSSRWRRRYEWIAKCLIATAPFSEVVPMRTLVVVGLEGMRIDRSENALAECARR